MKASKEKWRYIPNYNNRYLISDKGRVKSIYKGKEYILKQYLTIWGYKEVRLSLNGKHKGFRVHRLVAMAFIPNPNNLPCVNHKSEIRTDNFVENLEWCDHKYNSNYGTARKKMSLNHINNATISVPIVQFDRNGTIIAEYPSTREASRVLSMNNGNLSQALQGKRKTCGGYTWKYKNN